MSVFKQLLVAFLMFAVSAPTVAKTVRFKIATIAPEGTSWMQQMRAAAEEIEERTQGRVKFKFYPGGVMGNDNTVLRKIRLQQLHGAAFTGGALSDIESTAGLYSLPMIFRSEDEVAYVRGQMDEQIRLRLKKKDFIVLGISNGGFAYLMSSKPISGLQGLQAHKIWIPEGDTTTALTFSQAGLATIPLALGDVYTGLQTGLVDTVTSTPTGAIAFQWHTKIKHMVDYPLVHLTGYLVVSRTTFEKASSEDQAVMEDVVGAAFKKLDEINRNDNSAAKDALRAHGVVVDSLPPSEQVEWQSLAQRTVTELRTRNDFAKDLFDVLVWHLTAFRSQASLSE